MRSRMNKRFYAKENDASLSHFPVALETKTRKPRVVALLALVLIVLLGGFFLTTQLRGSTKTPIAAPTPTWTPIPTETPTPTPVVTTSITPSPSLSATPSSTKSSSVDKTSGLNRAAITVSVRNGSGVAGAASKIAATLKNLGYTVGATGNATTFDYTDVTIQVKSTKATYLTLLKKDLGADYTIGSATKDLPAGESADAVVIVGK